jgi:hypothetical protein
MGALCVDLGARYGSDRFAMHKTGASACTGLPAGRMGALAFGKEIDVVGSPARLIQRVPWRPLRTRSLL